jgi:hypothetical protein
MNWDRLLYGLISLALGLIGYEVRSRFIRNKTYNYNSYTGAQFTGGVYTLIVFGILVIIWSFFSE